MSLWAQGRNCLGSKMCQDPVSASTPTRDGAPSPGGCRAQFEHSSFLASCFLHVHGEVKSCCFFLEVWEMSIGMDSPRKILGFEMHLGRVLKKTAGKGKERRAEPSHCSPHGCTSSPCGNSYLQITHPVGPFLVISQKPY